MIWYSSIHPCDQEASQPVESAENFIPFLPADETDIEILRLIKLETTRNAYRYWTTVALSLNEPERTFDDGLSVKVSVFRATCSSASILSCLAVPIPPTARTGVDDAIGEPWTHAGFKHNILAQTSLTILEDPAATSCHTHSPRTETGDLCHPFNVST